MLLELQLLIDVGQSHQDRGEHPNYYNNLINNHITGIQSKLFLTILLQMRRKMKA
jgi:hypothetical protein